MTSLPNRGESGEHYDGVRCALHEHLCNTCTSTEVTIDLERSVCVVEIVVDTASVLVCAERRSVAQSAVEYHASVVAVLSARPEVDAPAHRPTC